MPDSSCVTEIQYRFDSETYGIFRAIQERHFQHHPQPHHRAGQGRAGTEFILVTVCQVRLDLVKFVSDIPHTENV